ncbi:hypothetical protein [Saccharicrinis fermentans]|uniref:DNA polymerase III subunits gamma and tau n=1 Tax=Saccharicrinis fermentans DSM 9555 = JCM 21142 TaxID=869213 RepID=W7YPJ4_9BACT|nr:hypothetical protein [Saccharicrinis fermentans]GAF04309.1 DNA polymerase III subunits gamma and tau [Saccharicrinis fermentans DSM 9555 = JCM 21142]
MLINEADGAGDGKTNEEVITIDPSWNDPVDQDSVRLVWLKYAKKIEKTNPRLASILNNHIPALQAGNILRVQLKNKTQDHELKEQKTNIFLFLKSELRNANLELETQLMTGEHVTTKAFTAAEKAKLMAKKNPALLSLTKKFDLDVE